MSKLQTIFEADQPPPEAELDIEVESLGSVALARLIDEVRNGDEPGPLAPGAYNRIYHRHNR